MSSLQKLFNSLFDLECKEYTEKFVCFIDVLGSKEYLLNSKKPIDVALPNLYIKNMKDARDEFGKHLEIALFSDCAYIVVEKEHIMELLDYLSILTMSLLTQNTTNDKIHKYFMIRGGITYGNVYCDENTGFIVGPAVVNAYRLEGEAHLPIVMLDEKAQTILVKYCDSSLIKEKNSVFFVDWLNIFKKIRRESFDYEIFKDTISWIEDNKHKHQNNSTSIFQKFTWMEEYILQGMRK